MTLFDAEETQVRGAGPTSGRSGLEAQGTVVPTLECEPCAPAPEPTGPIFLMRARVGGATVYFTGTPPAGAENVVIVSPVIECDE